MPHGSTGDRSNSRKRDMLWSPTAWIKYLAFIAVVVLGPGLLLVALVGSPGNRHPLLRSPPDEAAREEALRAERREYRRLQRFWLERIEAGEASFAEADCMVDRGGEWDFETERCFDVRR